MWVKIDVYISRVEANIRYNLNHSKWSDIIYLLRLFYYLYCQIPDFDTACTYFQSLEEPGHSGADVIGQKHQGPRGKEDWPIGRVAPINHVTAHREVAVFPVTPQNACLREIYAVAEATD